MDFSKFKTSDWLKVGGGLLFLIAGFLPWWKVDFVGASASSNAFDYFFTGIIPWLIFIIIGVLTFLSVTGKFKMPGNVPTPVVFLAAAALGTLLVLIRVISHGEDSVLDDVIERGIGLWLALIAAIVVLVGCVLGFKESGGEFSDLTDMNKLKSSFKGGDDTSTPPPPPPPPATET